MKSTEMKHQIIAAGFDLVGICRAGQFPEHLKLQDWLLGGNHGEMHWLEKQLAQRLQPETLLPNAKSVIICATNYNTEQPYSTELAEKSSRENRGWISRYAWGEDYHEVLNQRTRLLCSEFKKLSPENHFKAYTDTGPISERVFAKHSGIGWIGKNTCLINPKVGSWLFLSAIITDLELPADAPMTDHCGKCTRCIDACPTAALTPYELDARKCISYLTIEHRGEIPEELKPKIGHHLYGCDICQDVCPWNKKAAITHDPAFQAREGFFHPKLTDWEKNLEQYPQGFKNSPLKRAKKEGLLRNLEMVKKNHSF